MTMPRHLARSLSLSIRQLRAVIILAEECNFTRAASRCHLSQPALSALIRGIEEDLQVRLFDRDRHSVRITSAGELFIIKASNIVGTFESEILDFQKRVSKSNHIVVAAMPSFATYLLPSLITRFCEQNPEAHIEIIDLFNEPCVEAVRALRADFGITSLESGSAGVIFEKIVDDPFFLVCRKDHPLAKHEHADLLEILEYPFIHYSPQTRVRHQIDAVISRLHVVMEIERLETIRALIESGVGITLAPSSTLRNFQSNQLAYRKLAPPGISRSVNIVRRDTPPEQDLNSHLFEALKKGIREFVESAARPAHEETSKIT